jgi:hypothetical protein
MWREFVEPENFSRALDSYGLLRHTWYALVASKFVGVATCDPVTIIHKLAVASPIRSPAGPELCVSIPDSTTSRILRLR